MNPHILPISIQTLQTIVDVYLKIIRRKETLSVLGMSYREQVYRLPQILNLLPRNINTKIIDLNSFMIEDRVDIDLGIDKLKKVELVIFMSADSLLSEKQGLIPYLNSLANKNQNLSFIYLFRKNIREGESFEITRNYSSFFQNILVHPLYSDVDSRIFINYLEKKFAVHVPEKIKEEIITECFGQFWLIKQALRVYIEKQNIIDLFSDSGIQMRLFTIYSEFTSDEKELLKKIVFLKDNSFYSHELAIIDHFLQLKLVKKIKNGYKLTIPLLERYIQQKNKQAFKIFFDKNELFLENKIVSNLFSKKEFYFIKNILSIKKELVSRDFVGNLFFESKDYTDWALDQAIKRIRTKLKKIGVEKFITTVKNKGYLIENNDNS